MTSDEKNTGLLHKYDVERVNDPTGKHADCRYFVLDPQHDPLAILALSTYSEAAARAGYTALSAGPGQMARRHCPNRLAATHARPERHR